MAKKQRLRISKKRLGMHHHLLNTFFPRAHNDYHPHFISRYGLIAMALIFTGAIGVSYQLNESVLGSQAGVTTPALLTEVNEERTQLGKTKLTVSDELTKAAQAKAQDMFENQYWAHTSPDGVAPWKWLSDQDYAYAYAGENLARNFASADSTVAAWMASPSHRDNILHEYYTEAGFAVLEGTLDDKPATITVALFATPASSLTEVAGATTKTGVVGMTFNPLAQIGIALQSMSPGLLGAMSLILVGMTVAGMTFTSTHMRTLRPRSVHVEDETDNPSWHQHHTVTKMIAMVAVLMALLMIFSGGSL